MPKGPPTNPGDKRLARRTEDHPLECKTFEAIIPEGEYGAGRVIAWGRGAYMNESSRPIADRLQRGRLSFRRDGQKLHGGQPLTRVRGGENEPWLLVETSDEYAGARRNPVRSQPESVLSGRTLDELG